MKLLTWNISLNFCIGRSETTDPSMYLWFEVGSNGTICPDSYLHINSTGANMDGTAQDADTALHIRTLGDVR